MNVASLELCKELFELSGWNAAGDQANVVRGKGDDVVVVSYNYDLGYLLRKLIELKPQLIFERGLNQDYAGAWCDVIPAVARGDTPENALCKLAIELWKQGVLNKKEDGDERQTK